MDSYNIDMDLRVFEYYLAIAREETISGAAETLHVSQPTLSRQMKELEERLGKKLFIRGNRKIILTEEGMILRKRAQEILDLVKKTENEISTADDFSEGDIYIGCGETKNFLFVSNIMKEMQKSYPKVRFHIIAGDSKDVLEHLDKGLYDFGLIYDDADLNKYERIILPDFDRWGILMGKDDELAKKEYIETSDIIDRPLIVNRNLKDDDMIMKWFKSDLNSLKIAGTYNLLYNASLMTMSGIGYSLALEGIVDTSKDAELCFRPLRPELRSNLRFIYKRYQIFSKAAEKFLEMVYERLEDKVL